MISSCLDLSFARMGTRSLGTGVRSLKFLENFMRSLSLMALSWFCWSRRRAWIRIFSMFANCRNESKTSVSTFVVAFSAGPSFRFGEADTVGAKARLLLSLGCSGLDDVGCNGAGAATGARVVCCSALGCVGVEVGMV